VSGHQRRRRGTTKIGVSQPSETLSATPKKELAMSDVHNVIIIGSGPAGLTAALYAARANLSPLVFEGIQPGGQLTITTDVENYPGFPDGIMGPELMELMRKQAVRFGSDNRFEFVDRVDFSQRPFKLWVGDVEYRAHAIILATGASARWLGVEDEAKFMGRGLSACATCDGFFFKGKELFIIGGGDTAMEEATFLTRFASKVTLVHRREELRASKIMADRALNNPKVDVLWNSVITKYLGDDSGQLVGARIRNVKSGEEADVPIGGVFLAIGHDPNTEFLKGAVKLDDEGYVVCDTLTNTSVEGVFACGDVVDKRYRQAVTAAGSGCEAALDAEKWLEAQGLGH
jgi:thioredoxin reductase (NADPH)